MTTRSLYPRMAVALFALIGLCDSLYLSIERLVGAAVICPTGGGCATVAASPYAMLLGILPVAYLGVLGYLFFLGFALMTLYRDQILGVPVSVILLVVASIGVIFATYLVYLQVAVIAAICVWCMVSAMTQGAIWVAALLNWRSDQIQDYLPRIPSITP